jgi:hypothetical protein
MVKDPMVPLAVRGVEGYSSAFLAAIDKGLAVMAHERPQSIDAFRELLGIESSGVPRARSTGTTQRFATLDRLPQSGTADEVTIIAPPRTTPVTAPVTPSAKPAAAAAAAGAAAATATAKPKMNVIHKPAPRWMSRVALGVSLLVIIGFGAKWLLSTPSDIMMPANQAEAPAAALPDAATAPVVAPAAVAATDEPGVEDILAQAATPTASAPAPAPAVVPAPAPAPAPTPATAPAAAEVLGAQVSPEVILASAPVLDEKPDTATYRLAIKPWGTVYVDGKEKGVSPPLKKLVLPSGKHKIRIANPGFPDYSMDVNLSKGKSGTIDHDFTRTK